MSGKWLNGSLELAVVASEAPPRTFRLVVYTRAHDGLPPAVAATPAVAVDVADPPGAFASRNRAAPMLRLIANAIHNSIVPYLLLLCYPRLVLSLDVVQVAVRAVVVDLKLWGILLALNWD